MPKPNIDNIVICWEDIIDNNFCINYKGNIFSDSKYNIRFFKPELFYVYFVDNINTLKIKGLENFEIILNEDKENNRKKSKRKI